MEILKVILAAALIVITVMAIVRCVKAIISFVKKKKNTDKSSAPDKSTEPVGSEKSSDSVTNGDK